MSSIQESVFRIKGPHVSRHDTHQVFCTKDSHTNEVSKIFVYSAEDKTIVQTNTTLNQLYNLGKKGICKQVTGQLKYTDPKSPWVESFTLSENKYKLKLEDLPQPPIASKYWINLPWAAEVNLVPKPLNSNVETIFSDSGFNLSLRHNYDDMSLTLLTGNQPYGDVVDTEKLKHGNGRWSKLHRPTLMFIDGIFERCTSQLIGVYQIKIESEIHYISGYISKKDGVLWPLSKEPGYESLLSQGKVPHYVLDKDPAGGSGSILTGFFPE